MEKEIIVVFLLGGLAALDLTEAFQSMWSQPLVSGPLIGWLLGDWQDGLLIGVLLQLLWLWYVPLGVAVFPDSAVAGVSGVAAFLTLDDLLIFHFHKVVFLVLLFTLLWSYFSGWLTLKNRHWNVNIVYKVEKEIQQGKNRLNLFFTLALVVAYLRGANTALAGFLLIKILTELFLQRMAFIPDDTFNFILPAVYGFGLAALFFFFGRIKNWLFILGGALAGIIILAI
jgi:mannose/fructose/N-acetylgalactosamine-specific phosphotransferase system component IIC